MLSIFSRKSDSEDNRSGNSESNNQTEFSPSVSSQNVSTPPVSKKRHHSSTNSEDDSKRQNINDSFLQQLDNYPSDPESSPTPDTDIQSDLSSLVPIDKNTPFWVPILFKCFDSLRKEITTQVCELSEEVKSLNVRFEKFENISNDILNRVESLEKNSDSANKIISSFENSLDATTQKVVSMEKDIVDLKQRNVELEKGMNFFSGIGDDMDEMKKEVGSLILGNKKLEKQ